MKKLIINFDNVPKEKMKMQRWIYWTTMFVLGVYLMLNQIDYGLGLMSAGLMFVPLLTKFKGEEYSFKHFSLEHVALMFMMVAIYYTK